MLPLNPKASLLLICLVFITECLSAQPANDDCSAPTSLTPGTSCVTTSGTLFNATNAGTPTSLCGTTYDVWYSFSLPSGVSSASVDLSVGGGSNLSSANAFIEAFSGASACSPTLIGSCTALGTTLNLSGLSPLTTYYLRVFTTTLPTSTPSSKWNFNICITYTPPPSNDECASAITLSNGVTNSSGTVWLATTSTGIPVDCATGTPDDDVWYKFTPSATNLTVLLTSVGTNLSSSGTRIQLFSGTCGTLSSVACGTTSLNATGLTAGNQYFIRVYSAGAGSIGGTSSGSIFSITATSALAPGNDECSTAYLIPTSTTCYNAKGTLTGATTSAGVPIGSCTGTPDDDVWYEFVATKSNPTITLSSIAGSITTTGGGARLQLLSGSCGSLTSVACGTTSISGLSLSVGALYYIRVYSL